MRRLLVIGASGGIGAALLDVGARRGWQVHGLSRRDDGLELTDEASVARCAAAVQGPVDRIVVATGALTVDGVGPERAFSQLDPDVMLRSMATNAVGPALVVKHFAGHLASDGTFAFLSARLASIGDNGLGGWMSYRASKAALNQVVRCASVEVARKRPDAVVVALHPGTIETDLTRPYARGRYTATAAEAAEQLHGVLDGLTAAQTGGFFDYAGLPIPW